MRRIGHVGDDVSALHEVRHAFHDQQPRWVRDSLVEWCDSG